MSDPAESLKAILEPVKSIFADMLRASGRPSVVQSESGVSSVKLNTLANGTVQYEIKIYDADPYMAAFTAADLLGQYQTYYHDHAPGEPFVPVRPATPSGL